MCIHVFSIQCCTAGSLHSYQQAFAWQRALVRSLVTNADKPQLLSKQSNILGDMLSSHSPRHAPHLHVNSRLVLAVGAYQTSMRSTQDGLPVVAWLQQSFEVPQHRIHPCVCLCVCLCLCLSHCSCLCVCTGRVSNCYIQPASYPAKLICFCVTADAGCGRAGLPGIPPRCS